MSAAHFSKPHYCSTYRKYVIFIPRKSQISRLTLILLRFPGHISPW